ncbi:MAG: hypothetical protein HKM90_05470 [Desulfobacteraceae bacterium]|nr:hypothetical protein [Desulfobacteraceae bacterium]
MLAAVLLAAGVLWHNGIIDPFKAFEKQRPVKKDEMKAGTQKGVPTKMAIPGKPKKASTKAKQPASVKGPEVKPKTPVPASQPVPKALVRTETPSIKKEISKPSLKARPETIAKKLKGETAKAAISKESPGVKKGGGKPAPDVKIPLPKSPIEPKGVPENQRPAHSNAIVSYPYSLLLYHFRSMERAKEAVSLYSKKGLSAYWVKVEFSNGIWYRVFVGYFEGREQAEEFRKDNGLMEAVVKKTAYAVLINTYTSSNKLAVQIQSLEDLGFSAYIIDDDNGVSRLYVGTFITKEGAETQRRDLESKGVHSQVVER